MHLVLKNYCVMWIGTFLQLNQIFNFKYNLYEFFITKTSTILEWPSREELIKALAPFTLGSVALKIHLSMSSVSVSNNSRSLSAAVSPIRINLKT